MQDGKAPQSILDEWPVPNKEAELSLFRGPKCLLYDDLNTQEKVTQEAAEVQESSNKLDSDLSDAHPTQEASKETLNVALQRVEDEAEADTIVTRNPASPSDRQVKQQHETVSSAPAPAFVATCQPALQESQLPNVPVQQCEYMA